MAGKPTFDASFSNSEKDRVLAIVSDRFQVNHWEFRKAYSSDGTKWFCGKQWLWDEDMRDTNFDEFLTTLQFRIEV